VTLDAHVVVRRPTFTLDARITAQPGEIVAVLGPNGAGKSTLLRALAGLQPLDDGHITLDGRVLHGTGHRSVAPPDRRVALVPQDGSLFPHLSARENVAFGPRARGADRHTARQLAEHWLDRLDLTGLGDRRPAQLSGGQSARVALARALATDPRLVLLDEPLAALDVTTRSTVRAELRRHLSASAAPSLLVTHDPLDATTIADRLVIVEAGRIVQQGAPADVAGHPATDYIAQLVGLNLWTGTTVGSAVLLHDGGTLQLAEPPVLGDGPVQLTLRPSAITLTLGPPDGSARNTWPVTITALEVLGGRARATLEGPPDALADVTVEAIAALRLIVGLRLWASCKATDLQPQP